MGYELINRITIKKDGVYISSHSNNDDEPFTSHRIDTLSKIYAEEGQKGLDREMFRMFFEYAQPRGNHKSVKRYEMVLKFPEVSLLNKKYTNVINEKYWELRKGFKTDADFYHSKERKEYDKFALEKRDIVYEGCAELCAIYDEQCKACEGCVHIGLRFPRASMYPCNACKRANITDHYQMAEEAKNEKE